MKIYCTLFVLFFSSTFFAQITISGTIKDSSGNTLYGASVFVDGTTFGTVSDEKGQFNLELAKELNANIVVQFFGFKSVYYSLKNNLKNISITLEEDVKAFDEVVVQSNIFTRKQMLKLFKEQFLGQTKAGKQCIIENEDEIYFEYDKNTFKFKAFSNVPLKISNPYLGYNLHYEMANFECKLYKLSIRSEDVFESFFAGNSNFTIIDDSEKIQKRRENVYEGSTMNLFRNLIRKEWNKKQFLLFEGSYMTNPDDHFTIIPQENGTYIVKVANQKKDLKMKGHVADFSLLYDKKQQSKVFFNTDFFTVDSYGLYSNYDKIMFSGHMSEAKVGDLLPANFGL